MWCLYKRENMEQKIKEAMIMCVSFLSQYIEDDDILNKDAELKELYTFIGQESKKLIKTEDNIKKYSTSLYDKLFQITDGEDLSCNTIVLSLGGLGLLLEYDYFKGSNLMKAKRLYMSVLHKVEKSQQGKESFRNAMKLVCNYDELERINNG